MGDFNGDGIADLAIGSMDSPVTVLLGKGDGTFQTTMIGRHSVIGYSRGGGGF